MKKVIVLFSLFSATYSYGQEKLAQDFDGDKIADTVFLSAEDPRIICKLSTMAFKEIKSKELELLSDQNGVRKTKNGFELYSSFMRAGNACQFRFDVQTKKMQLIGMSCYEFGNAANDGSGEGSVNLLTNTYIGEWSYYDEKKEMLVKLPKIKQKMIVGKIYLDTFDSKIMDDFLAKSSDWYSKQKSQSQK